VPPPAPSRLPDGQLGAGAALAVGREPAASPPAGKPSTTRALLSASDVTYLGSYKVTGGAADIANQTGFTLHYVKDELRFLAITYDGSSFDLVEFAPPSAGLGGSITSRTNLWHGKDLWPAPSVSATSIWWDDANQKLWSTTAPDYPGAPADDPKNIAYYQAVSTRVLNADGTVSERSGLYGFEGINNRFVMGGVQPVPAWFQANYSTAAYAFGWGGYQSRKTVGPISLGLAMLLGPDPIAYTKPYMGYTGSGAQAAAVPTKAFKVCADHRSAVGPTDWYKDAGSPSRFDRGQRNKDVLNYFDDPKWPSNPKEFPADYGQPSAKTGWLSPAPDGKGRMVDDDNYLSTGCWIDGQNKYGFIAVLTCASGMAYYAGSTLHFEGRHAELQVFDPDDFGKVIQGKMHAWNVQPVSTALLDPDLTPLGNQVLTGGSGNVVMGGVGAAAFDPKTKRLYLLIPSSHNTVGGESQIAVYAVDC
jgi:hypothetical protein